MSEQSPNPEQARIAALNDEFRRNGPNGDWIVTTSILARSDFPALVKAVQDFDAFTPDNDPWGEHDFGEIKWQNELTMWKIDYYNQDLTGGEPPLSPECRRILTILLASEY